MSLRIVEWLRAAERATRPEHPALDPQQNARLAELLPRRDGVG